VQISFNRIAYTTAIIHDSHEPSCSIITRSAVILTLSSRSTSLSITRNQLSPLLQICLSSSKLGSKNLEKHSKQTNLSRLTTRDHITSWTRRYVIPIYCLRMQLSCCQSYICNHVGLASYLFPFLYLQCIDPDHLCFSYTLLYCESIANHDAPTASAPTARHESP